MTRYSPVKELTKFKVSMLTLLNEMNNSPNTDGTLVVVVIEDVSFEIKFYPNRLRTVIKAKRDNKVLQKFVIRHSSVKAYFIVGGKTTRYDPSPVIKWSTETKTEVCEHLYQLVNGKIPNSIFSRMMTTMFPWLI